MIDLKNMKTFISLSAICATALLLTGCGGSPPVEPVFDVPSLVGKDINGVQAVLGTPSDDDSNQVWPDGDDEHAKTWTKGKTDLLVDFHSRTNQVVDFFIATDDSSGASSDKERMLALGNLKEDASNYRVEFVPAMGHSGEYTGVKARDWNRDWNRQRQHSGEYTGVKAVPN